MLGAQLQLQARQMDLQREQLEAGRREQTQLLTAVVQMARPRQREASVPTPAFGLAPSGGSAPTEAAPDTAALRALQQPTTSPVLAAPSAEGRRCRKRAARRRDFRETNETIASDDDE